ncbi:hypothetical protein L7F22_037208 [Adiantum nelumboides]|nr:hypothetical protein [Adiantum nelumboides]
MSQTQASQQSQRLRSFRALLDPTDLLPGHNIADVYSLRHLCLQAGGIPDRSSSSTDGWLRAQAWRVLLGYLSPDKAQWTKTLKRRRAEYYQFVSDFLPHDGQVESTNESSSSSSENRSSLPGKLSERDALLDQIFRDLARSRKNAFAFYRQEVQPSQDCPLAPLPESDQPVPDAVPRLTQRHGLLHRLEQINADYAYLIEQERALNGQSKGDKIELTSPESRRQDSLMAPSPTTPIQEDKPSITLQPASPAQSDLPLSGTHFDTPTRGSKIESEKSVRTYTDRHWHSLLRILYIYALLNPSIGYVQGMNEVLFIVLYVFGTSSAMPSPIGDDDENANASSSDGASVDHAEADAFWCFSALVGEVRELYDFDGIDHASANLRVSNDRQQSSLANTQKGSSGMGALLKRFSLRLRWLDSELWRSLREHSLDPRLPYYSFRWLACLLCTELSLPSLVRVWDALLAESNESKGAESDNTSPMIDFLIDISCALLINIRGQLLDSLSDSDSEEEDVFTQAMNILQTYPDDDIGPILEMAILFRQRRMAAPLTGDAPPTQDEEDLNSNLRDKALNAFREWRSPSVSSQKSAVTPRKVSDRLAQAMNTPSSSSPASRFQKYAEAIQTSDAAASISKASTNWQAKAMATWSGSKSVQSTPTKEGKMQNEGTNTSLSEMGSNWFQRLRVGSDANSSPNATKQDDENMHPSLRWSTLPPNLPIPNVLDSPPERQEFGFTGRMPSNFVSVNRLAATNNLASRENQNEGRATAGNGSSPGSLSSFDGAHDASSSLNDSPATGNFNRFAHLPSLQHAAAVAGVRGSPKSNSQHHQHSQSSSNGHHGLQPLMLQNAARPARDHSANGSVNGDEPSSRKVSSGPMAANVSPRGSAFSSRRRGENQSYGGHGSQRDSAFTTASFSSSMFRNGGENGGSLAGSQTGDSPLPDSFGSETWSTFGRGINAQEVVPPLPVKDYKRPTAEGLPAPSGSAPAFSMTSGRGTVAASAFGARDNNEKRGGGGSTDEGPIFGQVTSSADVPLASKTTLQRKNVRQGSTSTSTDASSIIRGSTEIDDTPLVTDASSIVRNSTESGPRPRGPRQSKTRDSVGSYENSKSAPVTLGGENEGITSPTSSSSVEKKSSYEAQAEDAGVSEANKRVRKYSLTDDGPTSNNSSISGVIRKESNSSARRASGGITRNRKAFSGKREVSKRGRGTSNRESQQSMHAITDSITQEAEQTGGGEEEQYQLQLNSPPSNESRLKRRTDHDVEKLNVGTGLSIVERGTSATPSPGPEAGKMFEADELLQMLEQNLADGKDDYPVRSQQPELLSLHNLDDHQFVSAEDIHESSTTNVGAQDVSSASKYDTTLLGPRSHRPISMPSDVDDFDREVNGGESGNEADEFYDAGIEAARTPEETKERSAYLEDGIEAIGNALTNSDLDREAAYGKNHQFL